MSWGHDPPGYLYLPYAVHGAAGGRAGALRRPHWLGMVWRSGDYECPFGTGQRGCSHLRVPWVLSADQAEAGQSAAEMAPEGDLLQRGDPGDVLAADPSVRHGAAIGGVFGNGNRSAAGYPADRQPDLLPAG